MNRRVRRERRVEDRIREKMFVSLKKEVRFLKRREIYVGAR